MCLMVVPGVSIPASAASMSFSNMSGWAEAEMAQALSNDLVPASLAGLDLTEPASRREVCEAAVMLYEKAHGSAAPLPAANPFTDTGSEAIQKAFALGITNGTSATTFSPDATISREQVATLYGRTIQKLYPAMDYATTGSPVFNDISLVNTWALNHVLFMAKAGIIKGSDGNFMPRPITPAQISGNYGTTSREQALAISLRIHNRFAGSEPGGNTDPAVTPTVTPTATPTVTPTPSADAAALERERLGNIYLSMVDTTPPPPDRTRFDAIDFEDRFFRPTYEPALTLQAINPSTGVATSASFRSLHLPERRWLVHLPLDIAGCRATQHAPHRLAGIHGAFPGRTHRCHLQKTGRTASQRHRGKNGHFCHHQFQHGSCRIHRIDTSKPFAAVATIPVAT
jgi:hypothetical protein